MTIRRPRPLIFRSGALLLAGVVAATISGQAWADTVVARFGPIEGVVITDIKDGRISYKNAATGKVASEDMGKIKGIKVDGVKGIEGGQDAQAAKDDRTAALKFAEAVRQAKTAKKPWLAIYAQHQLMDCYVRLGEPRQAAQQYLELVQAKADLFYFQPALPVPGKPAAPTVFDAVRAADENIRKAVFEQIQGLKNVDANHQGYVAALAEATGIEAAVKAPQDPAQTDQVATGPQTPIKPAPGKTPVVLAKPGALVLPARVVNDIRENAAGTADIQIAMAGRYTEGVKAMQEALRTKAEMTAVRLFVLGRVQQELAGQEKDAAKKADLLMDAALCYARIGAQFNEPEASYYAPALLEFARINLALGDGAAAHKAFEAAADLADKAEEPAYAKLYKETQEALDKK